MVCLICSHRPAKAETAFCGICQSKIDASSRSSRQAEPVKYVVYKGDVVGFYRNGSDKLSPRLVQRNPDGLPKGKTIDLNTYIEGYTREQVKKLKCCIKTLTAVF